MKERIIYNLYTIGKKNFFFKFLNSIVDLSLFYKKQGLDQSPQINSC